jgi:hypothetical protein
MNFLKNCTTIRKNNKQANKTSNSITYLFAKKSGVHKNLLNAIAISQSLTKQNVENYIISYREESYQVYTVMYNIGGMYLLVDFRVDLNLDLSYPHPNMYASFCRLLKKFIDSKHLKYEDVLLLVRPRVTGDFKVTAHPVNLTEIISQ